MDEQIKSRELSTELEGLHGLVQASTEEQVEREVCKLREFYIIFIFEMLNELGCPEAVDGSKFDQLMALPDTIRLGDKTPFELKLEQEGKLVVYLFISHF